MLLFFVVGDMLGGGIYALVGEVAAEVGGAVWAAFGLALAMAALTAAAYVELATKYPRAGGAAYYVNRAYGLPLLTFMVMFAVMASGVTSASALARGFGGDYLAELWSLPVEPVAVAFVLALTAVNLRGIVESVRLNVAFTIVEVGGLLLIVAIGVAALLDGTGEPSRALELEGGEAPVALLLSGAALAFYALIGFEDSANVAEEVAEPRRAYPFALFAGLAVAGIVYLLVTFTASMVVPTDRLAGSSGPLLEVVRVGPLAVPEKVFSAIALFALANGALINLIMASRLLYGMAHEGVVPRGLARLLPGRDTPWLAIVVTTALAVVLVLTGDLGSLARATVTLLLVTFAIVNVSVLVLRRDAVEHDHFRVPTPVPALGAAVSLGLLLQQDGEALLRAALVLALGLALWVVGRLTAGR